MGEESGSKVICIIFIILSLVAFGFAISAERRRIVGHVLQDPAVSNIKVCFYTSNASTGYGVGSFLFLLSSQSMVMTVTKCLYFGKTLSQGTDRARAIIYFIFSWITFTIAEACLIAGTAKNNAAKNKNDGICESMSRGIFFAGAVFVFANTFLNFYYYINFNKSVASHETNHSSSTVGMTGYL